MGRSKRLKAMRKLAEQHALGKPGIAYITENGYPTTLDPTSQRRMYQALKAANPPGSKNKGDR